MARNAMPATPTMIWVRWSSCFCSGVLSASVWFSNVAMLPISVLIPVPVTIISPRPRVTDVFMNARQIRSPRPTSSPSIGATSLSTGALSPVRAASSISSVAATISRPSAGTRLPASKRTMSPGTSSAASISIAAPSRRTRAMSFSIFSSAARLASAFDSCRRPRTALNTVRPMSTMVVPDSPVTTWFTTAAPTRMICIRSWYWRRKAATADSAFLAARTFEPCSCRRCFTSAIGEPPRRIHVEAASPPPRARAGTSECDRRRRLRWGSRWS